MQKSETCVWTALWYCSRYAKPPIHIFPIFCFCLASVFDDCNSQNKIPRSGIAMYIVFLRDTQFECFQKRHCDIAYCLATLHIVLLGADIGSCSLVCRLSCILPSAVCVLPSAVCVAKIVYLCEGNLMCACRAPRERAKGGGTNRIEATCTRARHTHTHTHVVAGGISVAQTHGDGSRCDDSIWLGDVT